MWRVILPSLVLHLGSSLWQHSWLNCLVASPAERHCLHRRMVSFMFCCTSSQQRYGITLEFGCTLAAGSWSRTATGCQWCSWGEEAERGRLRTEGKQQSFPFILWLNSTLLSTAISSCEAPAHSPGWWPDWADTAAKRGSTCGCRRLCVAPVMGSTQREIKSATWHTHTHTLSPWLLWVCVGANVCLSPALSVWPCWRCLLGGRWPRSPDYWAVPRASEETGLRCLR